MEKTGMGRLYSTVVRTQGRFSKGIGWTLGSLLSKGRGKDSNLQLLFGDAQLTPSLSLHHSPHSVTRNTCRPMLPCQLQHGRKLLSTDTQHGCSNLHWNASQKPALGPWVGVLMGSTHRCTHRPHISCSQCWTVHLLCVVPVGEKRDPIKCESCALSSAPVSCPRECCKRQLVLTFGAPCRAHQHLSWGH